MNFPSIKEILAQLHPALLDIRFVSTYLRTIWLFTYSDMKTIVFPQSIFGGIMAYTACNFQQNAPSYGIIELLFKRYPAALCWTWANLLPFNIFNQLSDEATNEDRMNKPWRPMPSERIDKPQAALLMLAQYTFAIGISFGIGGLRQCLLLIFLGIWYNAGGGANNNFVVRNLINSAGYLSFASGAMEVALGNPLVMTQSLAKWMGIQALIIFSTIQTQDLYDINGDASRNRKTMPLVIGDSVTRWYTAVMVLVFGVSCPAYWSLNWYGFILPALLGTTIAVRTLSYRTIKADRMTFRIWNAWLLFIYTLPMVRYQFIESLNCV